jgi:ribose transport system substrate-binding protein
MKIKSIVKTSVAAIACALITVGCSDATSSATSASNKTKLAISIPSADHGWTGGVVFWANKAKAELEAKYPNYEIIVSSTKDAADQYSSIENLIVQNIKALVILPHEPAPLTPVCKKVKDNGIKLVVVDRNLALPIEDLAVVGDNPGFGRVAGEQIAKALNGKGKVAIMQGILCQVNTDRVNAFKEVIAQYPEIEIIEEGISDWNTEKGLKLMENYLQMHSHIDAVWTGDDDVLLGALQAYKESGRTDVKTMLGGAGSKLIIKRIIDKDPLVTQTVTYPPKMVYHAAEEAIKLLEGAVPAEKKLVIPAEVIDASNAEANYYPESAF